MKQTKPKPLKTQPERRWKNRIVGHGEVNPEQLLANPKNWRIHPKNQQDALVGVLSEVGWVQDVIVNKQTGFVVDGHARVSLAIQAGERVPVVYIDLSEKEEALIIATLDPLSAMAATDEDLLASLVGELEVSDEAVSSLLRSLAPAAGQEIVEDNPGPLIDNAAQLQKKWQTAPGQLWVIGESRLLCGDSTSEADVRRLMNGQRACLFATDPPYLVDYDGTNHPHKWTKTHGTKHPGDKDWSDKYTDVDSPELGEKLYDAFVKLAIDVAITDNAAWYCWHASRKQGLLEAVWEKHGAFVHQQIIWAKDRPILTRSWYMWQHEPCFFGWRKGKKPKRVAEDYPPSVWQFPTQAPGETTDHPTQKPVELFAIPIRQHTVKGDLCYEPFAGSGTQFCAAEQLGRVCYGMEKSPPFVAVCLERMSVLGLTPQLVPESATAEAALEWA